MIMASYLDKENINTAITESTHLDLSHVHITTANFMQLSPIYNKEMVPGEKIDVNVETFSRMNSMPVPTYGRCNIKNRAYFVPFRTVFRGWTDFITDAPHHNSMNNTEIPSTILSSVPTVTNKVLIDAMTTVQYVYGAGSQSSQSGNWDYAAVGSTQSDYDFKMSDGRYYKFTCVGRQINKILESLGYKVNWNISDTTVYSALPLLAWCKVYIDWYFPSVYTNTAEYSYLSLLCNSDTGIPAQLNSVDVGRILQMCYTCYDSDYFVSAWDKPNEPSDDTFYSNFRLVNLDAATLYGNIGTGTATYTPDAGYVTNNGSAPSANTRLGNATAPFISPYVTATGAGSSTIGVATPISQYLLHGLHALTDYMKRHQLAGSRAMDRYLARFGKALPAEKLNRSIYLGSQVVPVQFGDVMSTADTENASVGDYAGKGLAYGQNGNFTFSTNEYGMFIIVSTITPATGYYQGIDRTVKHVSKLDFWTPEFDSLGVQAITADELYVTRHGDSSLADVALHESIFGFAPKYAEYKVGRDQVTGNFRIPTLNGDTSTNNGTASWHLMRDFDDSDFVTRDASGNANGFSVDQIKHNINFVYSRGDIGQYNRIFFDGSDTAADNFTLIHNFNIGDYAPMKPLYDNYEFEDRGHEVRLDVNGVKHN